MTRIDFTDRSGRWFNRDTACRLDEDTNWDGSNQISINTGSQWDHESLYFTKSGVWVRRWTSQWQGSSDSINELEECDAIDWIVANNCDCSDLPSNICDTITARTAALEV